MGLIFNSVTFSDRRWFPPIGLRVGNIYFVIIIPSRRTLKATFYELGNYNRIITTDEFADMQHFIHVWDILDRRLLTEKVNSVDILRH